MDKTRRKVIQSIAAASAAAGVAASLSSNTNAAAASTVAGPHLAHPRLASSPPQSSVPQPIRDGNGGTDPGPRNIPIDEENPDLLVPPPTDAGDVDNLKWPFGLSAMRLSSGGWARQTTIREFPVSTDMAGVDMRLKPGAIRELHWHVEGEWGYITYGTCQITCLDSSGRNFVDNLTVGDMWFFPSGAPHSIQAFEKGVEFLLVFTNGIFSENDTFLLSDTFDHLPKEVLAKNFGVPESDFDHLPPASQRWIYPGKVPPTNSKLYDPYGTAPAFSYHLSQNKTIHAPGGEVNVVDAGVFPVTEVSAALVMVNPGHMRAIHWHTHNEWQYYIEGTARMTAFAAESTARTFDYQAGDAGYVPNNFVHYIENTGKSPLRFLEIFSANRYIDFELAQWMGVTPPWLVQGNLNVSQAFMNKLPKTKQFVV